MRRLHRVTMGYALISLFVFLVSSLYNVFARGVTSLPMLHAFYYPLFLGMFLHMFLIFRERNVRFAGSTGYRLFENVYNSGVACLTVASILTGIFEIAGTDSPYLPFLTYAGWGLVGVGAFLLLALQIMLHRRPAPRRTRRVF